jgi:hypothetical protein
MQTCARPCKQAAPTHAGGGGRRRQCGRAASSLWRGGSLKAAAGRVQAGPPAGTEAAAAAHGASVMTGVPPAAHRPSGSLLPGGLTMADSGAGLGPAYRPVRVAPAMRMEVITSHGVQRFEQVHDRVRQAHERIA